MGDSSKKNESSHGYRSEAHGWYARERKKLIDKGELVGLICGPRKKISKPKETHTCKSELKN